MPMYWTFNCFLGCILYSILYRIYSSFSSKLTFKSWILTSEKKGPTCPNWGDGGAGWFRWFGQCPKENVFLSLTPSLTPIEFWTKALSWIACHCLTRSSLWCWLYCLRKWDLCMRRNYWLWRKEGSGNNCKAIPAMKLVQMKWHFPLIFFIKGRT